MNVLYISYDGALDPLGQSQVVPYLERLSSYGHRFVLLTFEKSHRWSELVDRGVMTQRLADAKIEWRPLRYHKRFSVGATVADLSQGWAVASRLVKQRKTDLIHARSYPAAAVARAVSRRTGVPYVFDMRGLYPEERVDGGLWSEGGTLFRLTKRVETALLRDAAAVVTLTNASIPVVQSLMAASGSAAPLDVIPTSVDLKRFLPATANHPRLGRPILAYLGSLGTWYMLPEMLQFGRAAVEHAGARLRFIVNDPEDRLRPLVTAAHLRGDDIEVRSVPYSGVPASLADTTATFAFIRPTPSKIASAATKMSESLAMGLPVAVNEGVGDSAELVRTEGLGVIVDPSDPASFPLRARELVHLGQDEMTRRRCRATAEKFFDLEAAAQSYDRMYSLAAARRPSTR